jgi:glycerol kinase
MIQICYLSCVADSYEQKIEEVSGFGVAMMADLAVGLWRDLTQVQTLLKVDKVFSFKMNIETVQKNCRGWKQAVVSVLTNK